MAGVDILSDSTGKSIVAAIKSTDVAQARISEINQAAELKKNEVLASIPEDYRNTVDEVNQIKGDIDELNENVKQYVSPNILDKSSVLNGKRISTTKNSYTDASWASCIPSIDTEPGTKLFFNFLPYQINFWYNDTLVGTSQSFDDEGNGWYSKTVYSNANCFAVEWNNTTSGFDINASMIAKNEIPSEYQEYGFSYPTLFGERVALHNEITTETETEKVRCTIIPNNKIIQSLRISNTLSVGDKFQTVSYNWRGIISCDIPDNIIGIYVAGTYDSIYPKYAIVNSENIVVKISTLDSINTENNYGYYIDISDVEDVKKIYFESSINVDSSTVYWVYDENDFNIYNGDMHDVTFSSAIKTSLIENDMPVMIRNFTDVDNTEVITFSEIQYCRSVGIWLKMQSYELISAISNIFVGLYMDDTLATTGENENPQCLQMGNWVFLKVRTLDRKFNNIKITVNISDTSETIPLQIGAYPITNHFNRPIVSIDFDHTWQATSDCGVYDDLIDNNIPFTITGGINHEVDKLKSAHIKGLLDVGSYAGGTDGTTIGDNMSFENIISALAERIDNKVSNGYDVPTSFGGGGHAIPPRLRKALETCGYTSIKGGTMGGINSVTCKEPQYIYLGCSVDMAMTLGGVYFYFAHGVSTNPSGEDNPSMYDSYSNFSTILESIISHVNSGGAMVKNMKQFSEYMTEHNLIN